MNGTSESLPRSRRLSGRAAALAAAVLASGAVGCGHVSAGTQPTASRPVTASAGSGVPAAYVPAGYHGRFRGVGMVLENSAHGPQLCADVATSYPPQCGGLDLVGWNWSVVPHHDANGVRWSDSVTVTGTLQRNRFTLTKPVRMGGTSTTSPELDSRSRCLAPAGGWRPVDPAKATQEGLDAAVQRIRNSADYAAIWVDQSYLRPGAAPEEANDPTRLVLNVQFTGDLEAHVQTLREVWGGALCVTRAQRSNRSLVKVQEELLADADGGLQPTYWSTAVVEQQGRVDAQSTVAWWDLQQQLDTRYGKGVVHLSGWLTPVD